MKVGVGRKVASVRSLVNARGLQLQYVMVLHEILLVPVLIYRNETMILKGKKRSRIRTVQMDNLKDFLGIRRMDKVLNALIRELYGLTKESM